MNTQLQVINTNIKFISFFRLKIVQLSAKFKMIKMILQPMGYGNEWLLSKRPQTFTVVIVSKHT